MHKPRCIVPNCDSTHSVQHYLPSKYDKREKWLHALNRVDLLEKPFHEIRSLKVCGAHFDPAHYRTVESFLLNRNAMPNPVKKEISPPTLNPQQSKDEAPAIGIRQKKKKCIVEGCDSLVKPYHRLPINKEMRLKWLHNLERNDLSELPFSILHKRGVCGAHFDASQYFRPGSVNLLRTAVPQPLHPIKIEDAPSSETSKEPMDIVDDLLKDAAISTGTVTAPLLCHNKVLLKTKSTYSKHKYKMTFNENETSSQIHDVNKTKDKISTKTKNAAETNADTLLISDVFQVSEDEYDNEDYTSNSSINCAPTTSTKPKSKYTSVLKENITKSKKRKYNEMATEIEDIDVDKYDTKLHSILEEVKSLPNFLDIIFGFLYRRTDYFQISSDQNLGVGLPNGVAQKLLWQAFKKYENKPGEDTPVPIKNETSAEQMKSTEETIAEKSAQTKENKNESRLFETYNGAVFENYAWSQSISDLDIQIKIPDKVTCKQLHIDITCAQMTIKLKNTETVYLTGDLCKKCKMNETVWSLGGHILQIHLEKEVDSWWDCLLTAEPRLDFNKMDYPRPFKEDSETRDLEIQQICSSEIDIEEEMIWKDEETTFVEEYGLLETDL